MINHCFSWHVIWSYSSCNRSRFNHWMVILSLRLFFTLCLYIFIYYKKCMAEKQASVREEHFVNDSTGECWSSHRTANAQAWKVSMVHFRQKLLSLPLCSMTIDFLDMPTKTIALIFNGRLGGEATKQQNLKMSMCDTRCISDANVFFPLFLYTVVEQATGRVWWAMASLQLCLGLIHRSQLMQVSLYLCCYCCY